MPDKDYIDVISSELVRLATACSSVLDDTPEIPLGRPRTFCFAPGLVWPCYNTRSDPSISFPSGLSGMAALEIYSWKRDEAVAAICDACKWQPKLILRALRRIEAATRWCEARAAGRKRAAEGMRRQQMAAIEYRKRVGGPRRG